MLKIKMQYLLILFLDPVMDLLNLMQLIHIKYMSISCQIGF